MLINVHKIYSFHRKSETRVANYRIEVRICTKFTQQHKEAKATVAKRTPYVWLEPVHLKMVHVIRSAVTS